MTPHPSVLLGLRGSDPSDLGLREQLEGWVGRCGYRTRFTADAHEAISWLDREDFAATLVDSEMGRAEGEVLWRRIRPVAQRRVVLLARDSGRNLWFEALRSGVASVLPFPPREAMVQAALKAVTKGWNRRP